MSVGEKVRVCEKISCPRKSSCMSVREKVHVCEKISCPRKCSSQPLTFIFLDFGTRQRSIPPSHTSVFIFWSFVLQKSRLLLDLLKDISRYMECKTNQNTRIFQKFDQSQKSQTTSPGNLLIA